METQGAPEAPRTGPPTYRFVGGPLDGQIRAKTEPGRWSSYRDAMGDVVPAHKIAQYLDPSTVVMSLYYKEIIAASHPTLLGDNPYLEGRTTFSYVWLGE
jgi:hypothetical protein